MNSSLIFVCKAESGETVGRLVAHGAGPMAAVCQVTDSKARLTRAGERLVRVEFRQTGGCFIDAPRDGAGFDAGFSSGIVEPLASAPLSF